MLPFFKIKISKTKRKEVSNYVEQQSMGTGKSGKDKGGVF